MLPPRPPVDDDGYVRPQKEIQHFVPDVAP